MKRICLIIALFFAPLLAAFTSNAAPKIPARQVSVDPAEINSSTGTTVQAVLEDFDNSIPVPATTTTPGIVRFSTQAEVNAGTGTVSVITPADLAVKARYFSIRYSGMTVYTGAVPSVWTNLDLSSAVGTNRAFAVIQVIAESSPLNLVVREAGTTNDVAGAYNTGAGMLSGFAMDGGQAFVAVITDTNGVINIKSITYPGTTDSKLKVGCYQILGD